MVEPGWIDGDDVARGLVEECRVCEEISFGSHGCGECGYNDALYFEEEYDPDYDYEVWGGAGE